MGALPPGLQTILFGLGALTYAKHPEGILEFQKRRSLARVQRMIDRFKGRGASDAPETPDAAVTTAAASGGA